MLQVKNLSFEINENGKEHEILKNISFEVPDGELLVITGPNGGGKSTLAKVLMGIYKESAGEILLDGQPIQDMDIDHRAKAGFGFAFQQPPRFKGMKVKRLLALAAGGTLKEELCCSLLSSVGLCAREYLDREVDGTLSGGEMKRIEIASVLAGSHKISIFDEPEAGIDLWSFGMLVKQFEQMHQEKKESIIIISHQERIINMADRIMVVRDGEITQLGTKEDVIPHIFMGSHACMKGGKEA